VTIPQPTLNPSNIWDRAVVITTPGLASHLAAQLAATPDAPRPVGCLLTVAGAGGMLPVLGEVGDLPRLHAARPFTAAIVSLPAAEKATALRVRAQLRRLGIVERFVPTLLDTLAQGPPTPQGATDLDAMDLIGRMPYGIDRRSVARIIEGKRVLITGAGGSIGSELSRIAATFKPAQLILVERSENALFEIDRQLARLFPDMPRKAVLHDVVDADATLRQMVQLKPHTVFHAAAHKHVPLMEENPAHAVTNNLFGTKSIADAALAVGTERFVMISSDKAVNPTSVMGATKRLAEMYVQSMNDRQHAQRGARTSFTMVRFGNVLGSACSVVPIWSAQLAEGGPVTVTDPRMTRYFMTIPEAATLVLQAGAIDAHDASGGAAPTIFVLDMGEPIRILDLAKRFIALQGFDPGYALAPRGESEILHGAGGYPESQIDIVFTGARPGEKLYEELSYSAEALLPTPYPGILALAASVHADFDVTSMVAELSGLRGSQERAGVIAAIRRHVPEMRAANTVTEHKPKSAVTATVAAA